MGFPVRISAFVSLLLFYTSYGYQDFRFDGGNYALRVNYTGDNRTIEFTITANTTGWVGFGVGPFASMTNSDLVIGGVNNSSPYYRDMHALRNGPPINDAKVASDWELMEYYERNNQTHLKYRRLLNTTDPNRAQDFEIKNERQYVLWSYGVNDNVTQQHSKRGSQSVQLMYLPPIPTTTTIRPPIPTTTTIRPPIPTTTTIRPPIPTTTTLRPSIPTTTTRRPTNTTTRKPGTGVLHSSSSLLISFSILIVVCSLQFNMKHV